MPTVNDGQRPIGSHRLLRALKLRTDPMYWRWRFGQLCGRNEHYRWPDGLRSGVLGRNGTTDSRVFKQIFGEDEYQCVEPREDPEWIVDLGANVGYSSVYFLNRFRSARIVALEPDRSNYAMLRRNLIPYGARATAHCSAIWSSTDRLKAREEHFRGGGEWARQFQADPEGTVAAVDMHWILHRHQIDVLSILKMDIEGAEVEIFKAVDLSWLDRVKMLVIEIHDDSDFGNASGIILPLMRQRGFESKAFGELMVFEHR